MRNWVATPDEIGERLGVANRQVISNRQARALRKRIGAETAAQSAPRTALSSIAVSASAKSTGRPRKDRDRYANGRLKPEPPNPVVMEQRRALAGVGARDAAALRAAGAPLDLARARGWLASELYDAAQAYAALWRRAFPGIGRVKSVDPGAVSGGTGGRRSAPGSPVGDVEALRRLRGLGMGLARAEARALFDVCVLNRWPEWLLGMALVRDLAPRLEDERAVFLRAVERLAGGLAAERRTPSI